MKVWQGVVLLLVVGLVSPRQWRAKALAVSLVLVLVGGL